MPRGFTYFTLISAFVAPQFSFAESIQLPDICESQYEQAQLLDLSGYPFNIGSANTFSLNPAQLTCSNTYSATPIKVRCHDTAQHHHSERVSVNL